MTPTQYISTANEDLKSAMVLYKNKQYPQSLFYTEQSIEKLCKYIIIKNDILPEEKLKNKIGHNSTKAFDIITNYLINKINESEKSEYSYFENSLRDGKNYLIQLREKRKQSEITIFEMEQELAIIESYIHNIIPSPYDDLFKQPPEDLLNTLIDMNLIDKTQIPDLELKLTDKDFLNRLLIELKEYATDAPKYQNYIMALLSLAGLFSNHWESTRYPKDNLTPQEKYTKDNLIIKYLPKFQKLINKLIRGFEKFKL